MEKFKLKAQRREIFEVDYYDFDEFVNDIYNGNFEFVADHEANNSAIYDFKAPNMNIDFDGKYEAKIRQGDFNNVPVNAIFNVLYDDGHIEEGIYYINVS
jgi:hypothetical protein